MPFPCRHISICISCDMQKVYAFVSNPANLPLWASGLSNGIREEKGEWFAASPMGEIKIIFAPQNDFGILDHQVIFPKGQCFSNPMRVFSNGDGCEVVFSLLNQPSMTDDAMETDAQTIMKDLTTIKRLMEK